MISLKSVLKSVFLPGTQNWDSGGRWLEQGQEEEEGGVCLTAEVEPDSKMG